MQGTHEEDFRLRFGHVLVVLWPVKSDFRRLQTNRYSCHIVNVKVSYTHKKICHGLFYSTCVWLTDFLVRLFGASVLVPAAAAPTEIIS
jgi:hypothetical protein